MTAIKNGVPASLQIAHAAAPTEPGVVACALT
jgi:hypothetical protein